MALSFGALALAFAGPAAPYTGWGFRGFPAVLGLPFAIVGLLILRRHPRHALGWVFSAIGLVSALQAILFEYGTYALVLLPGALPAGIVMAWILHWYWIPTVALLAILLILFPDGRLPSGRWSVYLWLLAGGTIIGVTLMAILPGPLDTSFAFVDNPFGWDPIGPRISEVRNVALVVFVLLSLGAASAGLIGRMRRSHGLERQQFKWFVFAAALLVVTSPASGAPTLLTQAPFMAAMLFLPVAIGIAILRHRLYDIDLIIRRTLVYSALTAVLALVYFGGVATLQGLVTAVGGQQSAVAVVISTLAIAALFSPLRRGVQDFIDRRFYRRKYDAVRQLAEFGAAARDETDLERLNGRLLDVVQETMQPAHASMWLRATADRRRSVVAPAAGGQANPTGETS